MTSGGGHSLLYNGSYMSGLMALLSVLFTSFLELNHCVMAFSIGHRTVNCMCVWTELTKLKGTSTNRG